VIACALAAAAGCAKAAEPAPTGFHLTATLASPTEMKLSWTGGDPSAAGRVVEFATAPDGQYTVLEYVPPGRNTYTHADLMPDTTFYYRVRPYYGPTSNQIDVTLPPGPVDENAKQEDQPWAQPQKVDRGPVPRQAIRGAAPGTAAPSDLTGTVMPAGGIRFTWIDHATDEEGYLLELKTVAGKDFSVAAVLDPDIDSVGLLTLPDQRSATFRVRAFYYGPASNIAYGKS
jgi:hypothetical protein